MNLTKILPLSAVLTFTALTATAGNIPQYSVSNSGKPYEAIQGTPITCNYKAVGGTVAIYPIGTIGAPYVDKGFPIGFDLKFGGRWFNQFIVTSAGKVYLGEDEVEYYGTESFILGMSPISHGLSDADISYLTSGEPGERVFTVQFANAVLAEEGDNPGMYDMQIRIYEADSHAEIAFREQRAPHLSLSGFDVSLHGWDDEDSLVITATDIEAEPVITSYQRAYMLDFDSYVHWNTSDGGELKSLHYSFEPESSTTPPKGAPTELTVTQKGRNMDISVNRARDARATAVLWSRSPITDADLPGDGDTFRGSTDGELATMLGDSQVLYYGPARQIHLTVPGVEDATEYYVTAISANGYPAFNIDNMAQEVFRTSQPAPQSLQSTADGTGRLTVSCKAQYPVIIAKTSATATGYKPGFNGIFGRPDADAAPGDAIPGGGEVVYVGDPCNISVDCDPNQITYFRAWTLLDGCVSSNSVNSYAIPEVSFPYAPGVECYPWGEEIPGWITGDEFVPWFRIFYKDYGVHTITPAGYIKRSLSTPLLPLDVPVNVSFEFAMETKRDDAPTNNSGGIPLPRGHEPGWFGPRGFLHIRTGNDVHKVINKYEGEMVGFDDQGYNDYSSTWQPVSFDIQARSGMERITWECATEKESRIYIRNIVITPLIDNPTAPAEAPADLKVTEDQDGIMTVTCHRAEDAAYTIVLFSTAPMTDSELPTDGELAEVGDMLGNATVLYLGTEDEIECSTCYMKDGEYNFIFADYDTDYYVRAISGSSNPMYNVSNMAELTYRSLPDPNTSVITGIEEAEAPVEIYTLTGIRLDVADYAKLPAGLYIVNGKKLVIK